ncbi:conserved hypothetical protein [Thiomonas delicata]|uniref:Uncharacterized protein n=1 Tax=Thiomonas delicata TaxID=364030 RepID=A0A238D2H3_THIDL|nr:conserved hypothetical protein [Thiomonas delicata]
MAERHLAVMQTAGQAVVVIAGIGLATMWLGGKRQ